jgi:hypothetical protein
MSKPIITEELKNTIFACPHVDTVYFDAQGRHYFNVFKLIRGKGAGINAKFSDEQALFGSGTFSHRQLIDSPLNVDGLKEDIAKGDPDTEIVTSMTRDEILQYEIEHSTTELMKSVGSLTDDQKKQLIIELGLGALLSTSNTDDGEATPPPPKPKNKA